ncbi:MAG: NUDIX hydrolase [Thermaurantimonas sp.]
MRRQFSIRVYAIIDSEDSNHIVACREQLSNIEMIKFPGGGLEWGEGVEDCLRRELKEELGLVFFEAHQLMVYEKAVISIFNPDVTVIPVYYKVNPLQSLEISNREIIQLLSIPKNENGASILTFENDREAFRYYLKRSGLIPIL